MKALILVDIQNDFLPGGSLPVAGGDLIIPLVNKIQADFDLVVATQDWHPANHKSFASMHEGKSPYEVIMLRDLQQVLWPDHCVQGSQGAEFSSALDTNRIAATFRKGMNSEIDSYSGFYDNGHLHAIGLSGYLKERGVGEVYVCGLAADFCVFFTAMDSLKEVFSTFIISEATKAIDEVGYSEKKQEFIAAGGKFR
ncbi:bifunctional nicotinamidase/pyrazinamidase [Sphingobacterium sp. MYb382]|uniref:bifunctional nicotinamidase/pyrazinamidase n=1 Tax=Sphingobacterium sp. MYb382 TaxID=2745278 RepID=UPI0030AA92AF